MKTNERSSSDYSVAGPWHLDKRIPLALIGAILIQTGGAFWWASGITERVSSLETWRRESKDIAADIAVIKSQVADMREMLKRIDGQIRHEPDQP